MQFKVIVIFVVFSWYSASYSCFPFWSKVACADLRADSSLAEESPRKELPRISLDDLKSSKQDALESVKNGLADEEVQELNEIFLAQSKSELEVQRRYNLSLENAACSFYSALRERDLPGLAAVCGVVSQFADDKKNGLAWVADRNEYSEILSGLGITSHDLNRSVVVPAEDNLGAAEA